MTDITKFKDDFVLFLEAGFIAVNQADEDSAVKLFKAAQLLDPQNTLPKVGLGYLHLHKLELRQAVQLFEDVLKKEPNNEMASTFLGLCLTMSPNAVDRGEEILKEMKKSPDKLIKNLSKTALDFVDKFIKKDAGPAEIKPKKHHPKAK
ncbi:MAG TPA: hypothetical protein VLG44_01190 [Chlamydiales bacterium]|nr:hypothetical protein [Chlamydiales bacterium]